MEPHVYVVSAGFEHQRLTNLFPSWESDKKVAETNRPFVIIKSPHRSDASEELKKLSRDRYSLAELKKKPLPEGVDPKKLETYLGDEDFKVNTWWIPCVPSPASVILGLMYTNLVFVIVCIAKHNCMCLM